ncbi:MAG: response regulator [Ruminococcaceae bacterium]|nr:response regulator [Oscillospiraceae bacterium]
MFIFTGNKNRRARNHGSRRGAFYKKSGAFHKKVPRIVAFSSHPLHWNSVLLSTMCLTWSPLAASSDSDLLVGLKPFHVQRWAAVKSIRIRLSSRGRRGNWLAAAYAPKALPIIRPNYRFVNGFLLCILFIMMIGWRKQPSALLRGGGIRRMIYNIELYLPRNAAGGDRRMQAQSNAAAALLSNLPAMVFSKDAATGRYLACNEAFAAYARKTAPEEIIGRTDFELFDALTAAHFAEKDRQALESDAPYVYIDDVKDAAGNPRHFQTTKTKFTDASGRECILGMCVDLALMTAEGAMFAREQEQDRMITALASDYRCVYHVDLDRDDAVCYRADPTDQEQHPEGVHFPYHAQFVKYANDCVAEGYREEFLRFIDPRSIRDGLAQSPIIAYRYLARRGGKEYYEMIRMAGVRHPEDRDDHIVHAVGLGLTIIDAEMRDAMAKNQALQEALEAAENANMAKTAFLSNMSHEIRTPMNAIIGLDSLALRAPELPEETREYLEKIGGSARHLLGLINDILDMSRIESGHMVLRKEEFSFRGMLEQINTMVKSQCGEKGLKYECRLIGGVSDNYIGDDMKLKQVLINILSNAVKFTEAPGSVTLTVERTATFADQSTIKFVVKDTGVGMSKEFLPKVFESFTQENGGRSNKYGSTGLGMAIAKNIVELMNGTISVDSEKGVGTEFTVVVTFKNSDRQGADSSYIHPRDMYVLVVDDEAVAAEHARLVLDEMGIRADTCRSGKEALHMLELQQAKHTPYNMVLLDWKMPEMDGLETARQIRQHFTGETIIILTSFNWDEIMDEALRAGVDSFLAKPLFASNVIDEFERVARKRNIDLFRVRGRASLAGRHILMAEDILINAEIMQQLIDMKDAKIDHAENGRIALEMFAQSAPGSYDAILMDVRMPEMDGLEAAAAIRALDRPDAKTIPIIAMTANAFDEDVQRSLQVGMNAHLSKPVEPERLYQTLEELIWEKDQAAAKTD